ncbi:MAG: phosphate signaling complex protein PhoU [Oscillospiraceae bacterium]
MRIKFEEELSELRRQLTSLGALCEEAIAAAVKALLSADASMVGRVDALEEEIDRMERSIEALCLRLLLRQQPVARDLRQISAALKMITDMERIGDQAADIAEIAAHASGQPIPERGPVADMARSVIHMVTESVEAYLRQDMELAEQVIREDDTVDGLFIQVRASLIALIAEKPQEGEHAIDMMMIVKYLERIGDHAVNVAEWVEFSITGQHRKEEGK